jgi:hypothetical protein
MTILQSYLQFQEQWVFWLMEFGLELLDYQFKDQIVLIVHFCKKLKNFDNFIILFLIVKSL